MTTGALTSLQLVLSGFSFHRRSHLGVALGAGLAAAVLVGALLVGDSARLTLTGFALDRLGRTQVAAATGSRFFAAPLAGRVGRELGVAAAAVLHLPAVASNDAPQGSRRANQVQVLGVEETFAAFAPDPAAPFPVPEPGQVALSPSLADQLGVAPGDGVVLRVLQPALLPRDAPLAARNDRFSRRATLTVSAIVPDAALGRFGLAAEQVPPRNAFVPLSWLQERLGLAGRANILLVSGGGDPVVDTAVADAALGRVWRLEDVGLRLVEHAGAGITVLESDRVFLDPAVGDAALTVPGAAGALTYLVNRLSVGEGDVERSTPYSFVTALGTPGGTAQGSGDQEPDGNRVRISRWLADEIGAGPGDDLRVAYWELTPGDEFVEREAVFPVAGVVEMEDLALERALMPEFPGLSEVETCRDWDVGLPLDDAALADPANEAYWNRYRDTPKALFPLGAGRRLWGNRFGDLTGVRFPGVGPAAEELRERLTGILDPAALGLGFREVRSDALAAVSGGVPLGGLFLGMSAFLILAALLLTGLLAAFGVEQRSAELGTLLACGFTPRRVGLLLLAEVAVASGLGCTVGGLAGIAYTRGLLWGLANFWQGAVAGTPLAFHVTGASVVGGAAAAFAGSLAAAAAVMAARCRVPVVGLLSGEVGAGTGYRRRGGLRVTRSLPVAAAGGSLALVVWALVSRPRDPTGVFFLAGALLLAAGLGFAARWLARGAGRAVAPLTLARLAARATARRRGRSLTAAGLLACGAFLLVAVSAMGLDLGRDADQRWSGTGGFALFVETTLPVVEDPNSPEGRRVLGLDPAADTEGVEILPLKVWDGDDASCLNLNRANTPRLVGVDPAALSERGSFLTPGGPDLWERLERSLPDGVVPALAGDADTATWGLKKRVGPEDGDILEYRDERGEVLQLKLVGSLPMRLSVFQGTVLIGRGAFTRHFPSQAGSRWFLVDAPGAQLPVLAERLEQGLERLGGEVVTPVERLRRFYRVEQTYLSLFLALGAMGLALGCAGMAVVVLRNALERRGESAVLRAAGFTRNGLAGLLFREHAVLVLGGMVWGGLSAGVAVVPALSGAGSEVPIPGLALVLTLTALLALGWVAIAASVAARGSVVEVLGDE